MSDDDPRLMAFEAAMRGDPIPEKQKPKLPLAVAVERARCLRILAKAIEEIANG